ncbi:unnamed protein product [Bursaphelenchus okinawaensis]|uniref:Glutaminyl-peptide cyclotransferase n=1 Tax=Bursaphelenchus okinawaensis TaxID=465554 RepID=A0A811LD79_9BILA|nr:unnamed protein product [Bursaphelenchus okinawaensis]CAG9120402.1 unnamed protein product [Bursaphelenchus okinawaensis]
MLKSRHFLLASFVLVGITNVSTMAQWRVSQRPLQMSNGLTLNDAIQIASLTDMKTFYSQLRPILVPRIVNTEQHRQVAIHIQNDLTKAGFHIELDEFEDQTPYGKVPFRNIIATFDPHASRRLVLACHYDSKIIPGKVFIAATDSAVPCAMLLDLARTLGPILRTKNGMPVTLQLIFLDGEEAFVEWSRNDSTYGARHLAQLWSQKWYPTQSHLSPLELSKELDRIDAFVLLDLLGAARPQITHTIGHGTKALFEGIESAERNLRSAGKLKNIPPIFSSYDSYHAVEDDHIPFLERGTPIMHVIPLPFPRVWHTPADNEDALDWPTIYNLVTITRVFVAEYLNLTPN